MAQQVGAVWRDFEFEEGIVQPHELGERLPHRGVGREDEEPLGVVGEAEFLRRAHHPRGIHPAELRAGDLHPVRELRAGLGEGDLVPDLVVLRAANDLGLSLAGVDFADREAVGVGVLFGFEDLGDNDVVEALPLGEEALHLDPAHGEPFDHLLGGPRHGGEFLHPVQGEFHRRSRGRLRETPGEVNGPGDPFLGGARQIGWCPRRWDTAGYHRPPIYFTPILKILGQVACRPLRL